MFPHRRGQCQPRVGGNYSQQWLRLRVHRRRQRKHNSTDAGFSAKTCNRNVCEGGWGGGTWALTWPLFIWFLALCGLPQHHCLDLWCHQGYCWLFSAVCLDIHPGFTLGHRGERGEGQGPPFISTLIFHCDGWLSYCVICAFWKEKKSSSERKKWPASKSYNQAQFSEE